jgi:hypothetical protein
MGVNVHAVAVGEWLALEDDCASPVSRGGAQSVHYSSPNCRFQHGLVVRCEDHVVHRLDWTFKCWDSAGGFQFAGESNADLLHVMAPIWSSHDQGVRGVAEAKGGNRDRE